MRKRPGTRNDVYVWCKTFGISFGSCCSLSSSVVERPSDGSTLLSSERVVFLYTCTAPSPTTPSLLFSLFGANGSVSKSSLAEGVVDSLAEIFFRVRGVDVAKLSGRIVVAFAGSGDTPLNTILKSQLEFGIALHFHSSAQTFSIKSFIARMRQRKSQRLTTITKRSHLVHNGMRPALVMSSNVERI